MLAEGDECTWKIAKQLKDMNIAAQDADALQAHHKAIELERQLTEEPGGDTPIYNLYRYVPLWRVWFSSSLVWDRV